MKQIIKEYMFDRLKNQQGAILLPVVIALTSLLGAAVYYDAPGAIDEYAASLTRMRDGESTEEDLNAFPNAFGALANTGGGLPIPSDATDVMAISLMQATNYAVAIGIADTPAPPQAGTSLSNGCSLTLSSTSVNPGDIITATLTTPALLHSKIGNISCDAGVVGFGISIPGGTSPVSIPNNIEANSLTVKCYVIAAEGEDTICSPAVNVDVVHVDPEEGTCFARGLAGPEVVSWKGHEWQRCSNGQWYNWNESNSYCENLILDGLADWRLPTKDELKSLVVCTNNTPVPLKDAVDGGGGPSPNTCADGNSVSYDQPTIAPQFPYTEQRGYVTSTTLMDNGVEFVWHVHFMHGQSFYSEKESSWNDIYGYSVRCIR